MFALHIAKNGRILSVTYPEYAPAGAPIVDHPPAEGDWVDNLWVDGEYIYDPLPEPEMPPPQPTTEERIADLEAALDMLLSGVTE